MNVLRRFVPHPLLSPVIVALWLVLATEMTGGQIVLGIIVALAVPKLTERFWPDRPTLRRPLAGLRLVVVIMFDIVTANLAVARRVIGPLDRLHPSFVEVPLDLRDGFAATILGSIVSLTPGTVSIELDCERWTLLVHALDVEDEQALVGTIKRRYEAPLREVFEC
jgi:multicomponent K+:H+ antiporter subunit E